MKRLQAAAWALAALGMGAVLLPLRDTQAQQSVPMPAGQFFLNQSATPYVWSPVSSANPLPVSASVSASISGFAPGATGTPISVTTGGVTGSLPTGAVVAAFNVGTANTAYCKLGASATTSDIAIPPQSWFAFTVGAATQMTCITSTSTTTVNMVGGTGLPTGAGGGGGGSGGGGAVTAAAGSYADGALITMGTVADLAYAGSGTATEISALKGIYNVVSTGTANFGASLPSSGVAVGGRSASSNPTAASNGQLVAPQVDLTGKTVTSPYAIREAQLRGSASSTDNLTHALIGAQGASVKIYVTGVECGNTSASTVTVNFNDTTAIGSGTTLVLPAGGGNNARFDVPLVVAANATLTFASSATATTIVCNAQGFSGY